jgi:hypothetical protein
VLEIEFIKVENAGNNFLSPEPASKVIPTWFKMIEPVRTLISEPEEYVDYTIKKCIPVLDALTSGYVLKTNFDIYYEYDENENRSRFEFDKKYIENMPQISMHNYEQIRGIQMTDDYLDYAYKFSNPYVIKTPPGYSCIFTNPFNQTRPFYTLTGVVDTDLHELAVQFPFLIKKSFKGIIPKGTSIVQIIPFKRDDWKMSISENPNKKELQNSQKISDDFDNSRYGENNTLIGGLYKKKYRKKKKYF